MSKLNFNNNKTLKLTNVLKYRILVVDDEIDFNVIVEQMQSFIRAKGAMQVGPLIQYSKSYTNDDGQLDVEITMMLQCNNYIHNVESPYSMEAVIRVPNAMYCRYNGPETKLKYAYDKIQLEAFENDVELDDCNYTIYVAKDELEETIMADVFMPIKNG